MPAHTLPIAAEVFSAQVRTMREAARPVPVQRLVAGEPELQSGVLTNVVMSTSSRDRGRDTIAQGDAWKTANFEANPVVPWAHDYSNPPVGQVQGIERGERLIGRRIVFMDESLAPSGMPSEWLRFAMSVGAMYTHPLRFLRAFSIGMLPIRWAYNEEHGGVDFYEQELLELSACSIPMNQDCLSGAKAAGIDLEPWRTFAVKRLDGDAAAPAWMKTEQASVIHRSLSAPLVQVPDMSALLAEVKSLSARVDALQTLAVLPAAPVVTPTRTVTPEQVGRIAADMLRKSLAEVTGRVVID